MLPPPDVALAHYSDRQSLVTAGAEVAAQMWSDVDPASIVESWTGLVPELTAVLSGAQLGAARSADPYLDEVAAWQELDPAAASPVDPRAFAGTASDGRSLASLLMSPAFSALQVIASGLGSMQAMSLGRQHLDTIARTQVADAGRLADGVSMAAHRGVSGYVRVVVGKTCSRCMLLAGKRYKWNAGFDRHPRCDCIHLPTAIADAGKLLQSPKGLYDSMSTRERQRAGWSLVDQKAIADGADLAQVTNAHRGVYTAGGRKFTSEGATKHGLAGARLRGARRLTPEQIYAEARDRDEALQLLHRHGYLVNEPAIVRRAEGARVIARPGLGPTAAELAADPALKMTVANLKAIAKDNGVPLYGATKKHDIISTIRQWESDKLKSGGKVLLPDGPIGKPITFKPDPIEAPPLGVPSASQKILSGSSLNDWTDYFKYDQQYTRHEFVDAAGNTVAEGVRVQDLRVALGNPADGIGDYVVRTGTAWRFDGVAYLVEHGPDDFGAPWVSRALHELRAAHEAIPAAARANQSYAVLSGRSPSDSYWARRFNDPGHIAAASAGRGHIDIWRFQPTTSRINVDVLRHETGHNLDDLVARHAHGSESPAWASAADADAISAARITDLKSDPQFGVKVGADPARGFAQGVTGYGKSSAAEDYAESVMLYQRGEIAFGQPPGEAAARRLYFRDIYPERAKILDAQFPDLAQAQQQAIADLKVKATAPVAPRPAGDPSKLNVTQLRALAKERGIKVPSKALKADIVKLLQGGAAPTAPLAGAAKRTAARSRQAEIARRESVANVLAELDELIAKKAAADVFHQRLALATGIDAKDLAVLQGTVGDATRLRAAMTRIGTKNGLKPVGRAGQKVTFDDALHDALGAPPAPGAQVLVVRRGTTLTLDGETIPLDRAKVTTAVTPAKKVAPVKKAVAPVGPPPVVRSGGPAPTYRLPPGVTEADAKALAVALRRRESVQDMPGGRDVALLERLSIERNAERLLGEFQDRYPELRRLTTPQLKVELARRAREAFADRQVAIRVGSSSLREVLREGRFKTQFETGRSGGVFQPETRAFQENIWFGLREGTPAAERPIYGYLVTGGAGKAVVDVYGDVQVILRADVRSRTTAMVGDSMENILDGRPSSVSDPDWQSFTPASDDFAHLPIGKLDRNYDGPAFNRHTYIEAQVHGGVTVSDIAEVVLSRQPDAEMRQLLDSSGVPWRVKRRPS